jgi:hypothetical protein
MQAKTNVRSADRIMLRMVVANFKIQISATLSGGERLLNLLLNRTDWAQAKRNMSGRLAPPDRAVGELLFSLNSRRSN